MMSRWLLNISSVISCDFHASDAEVNVVNGLYLQFLQQNTLEEHERQAQAFRR